MGDREVESGGVKSYGRPTSLETVERRNVKELMTKDRHSVLITEQYLPEWVISKGVHAHRKLLDH